MFKKWWIRGTSIGLAIALVIGLSIVLLPTKVSITGEGNLSLESSIALAVNNPPTSEILEQGYTGYEFGDEIIGERTRNSKSFYITEWGSYTWDSTESLHYKYDLSDLEENWKDIDTTLVSGIAPWDWEMTDAFYHLHILEDFTYGQILKFEKQDESVAVQPMNLEWTNDLDQIQLVNEPQSVACSITDNIIRWNNAYGNGIDFQWEATRVRLEKILEIDSFDKLPSPEQYILDGGNPVLRLSLIFAPSKDVDIYVDGELWNRKTKKQTFNVIEFRKDGEILWGFMPLMYWDSEDNEGQSVATLEKSGKNLYVSIRVPYSWLESAIYPVFIDTNIDEQPLKLPSWVRANRWSGECSIAWSIEQTGRTKLKVSDNLIEIESKLSVIKIYPIAPSEQWELGSFRAEITHKKKPPTNKIVSSILSHNVVAHYQPPLTQQEIEDGCVRPDNIVGSYAFCHATRGNMHPSKELADKYKCSKFGHKPRPRIIDDNGHWVWAELFIDLKTGLQVITIPLEFYEYAKYPIRHDAGADTFGYTSTTSSQGTVNNYIRGRRDTCPEAGTLDSVHAYLEALSTDKPFKLGLYKNSNNSKVFGSAENTVTVAESPTWKQVAAASEELANVAYEIVVWGDDANLKYHYDTNSGTLVYASKTYNSWPTTQAFSSASGYDVSIYCTYTPEAAEAEIENLPASVDYGIVYPDTTYWSNGSEPEWVLVDGDALFTVTNNGDPCSITIVATDFTGGITWTLGEPAENVARLTAFKEGDDSDEGITLTDSPQSFISGLVTDIDWELKFESPTIFSFSDGVEKTSTITLAATLD